MYLDLIIFNWINGFAGKWEGLDYLGTFFAIYFEYVLLTCLAVALVINFKKYWQMVVGALVASLFVRFFLAEFFYWFHFKFRPFVGHSSANLIISFDAARGAFPSGHASFYFALSTIVYLCNKKAGILFYIGSFLIVLGRVFVGIHWPSDILAGAILGVLMGLALNKLFKKIVIKKLD